MKYGSRKFVLSIAQLLLICGLPYVYHSAGLSDDVTKVVLAGIMSSSLYHFANVLESKIGLNAPKS